MRDRKGDLRDVRRIESQVRLVDKVLNNGRGNHTNEVQRSVVGLNIATW